MKIKFFETGARSPKFRPGHFSAGRFTVVYWPSKTNRSTGSEILDDNFKQ